MKAGPMQYRRGMVAKKLFTPVAFVAVAMLLLVTASQPAGAQTLNALHAFLGPDGETPKATVTMDAAGNLYGTTQYGGTGGYGSVFKLVHRNGAWILNPLYDFPNYQSGNDGAEPCCRGYHRP